MKTTIDLPEELLRESQELARKEGTTLRALVVAGLRSAIASDSSVGAGFSLADASVDGQGLSEEFEAANWDQIRAAIYQ